MMKRMKGVYGTIAVAATILGSSVVVANSTATAQPADCADVYVTVIDGTGGNNPNSIARHWGAQYEGREGYQVNHLTRDEYEATFWPLGPYSYDRSVSNGADAAYNRVRYNQTRCPESKNHLIGHSQGADAGERALERLAKEGHSDNITADFVGNPRRVGGSEDVLPGLYPGASMAGPHGDRGNAIVRDHCDERDFICNTPQPLQNPIGFVDNLAGYVFGTKHAGPPPVTELPTQSEDILVPSAPQVKELPAPVYLPGPDLPELQLPPVEYGPLPNVDDVTHAFNPGPYVPTPVKNYLPPEVQSVLPPEVLNFIPPPLF